MAGYPMVNIKAILYDGSYHEVDSSEIAFKIAGSMAFQEGAKRLCLASGASDGRGGSGSGRIYGRCDWGLECPKRQYTWHPSPWRCPGNSGLVPLSEMFGYATRLRSLTQGRAVFTMEFTNYQEVPENLSEKILTKVRGY